MHNPCIIIQWICTPGPGPRLGAVSGPIWPPEIEQKYYFVQFCPTPGGNGPPLPGRGLPLSVPPKTKKGVAETAIPCVRNTVRSADKTPVQHPEKRQRSGTEGERKGDEQAETTSKELEEMEGIGER